MESENVSKSNAHLSENDRPRKLKVSSATIIDGGLGGPKLIPN